MGPVTDTHLAPVPFLPELLLHQADEEAILFSGGYRSDRPPPFWAFAWPGGQALARHVLDHPEVVAGRRVLDVASGSGIVAIAAAKAGAARVLAVDIDPASVAATERNAEANEVYVEAAVSDVTQEVPPVDVVLAGDVFYSKAMADRMLDFLRRAARTGARVLVGDPGRGFLQRAHFIEVTRYDVPVRPVLEDVSVKRTTIWEVTRTPGRARQG